MPTSRELQLPIYLAVPSIAPDLLSVDFESQTKFRTKRGHELAQRHRSSAYRHPKEYYGKGVAGAPMQPS